MGHGGIDRLLVDLGQNGLVTVGVVPTDGGLPETISQALLDWPLDDEALEDLRWYLEDYLRAPFGVWQDRGPQIQAKLAGWGDEIFASVFGSGPARDAYQRARDRGLELVFRSASPRLLGLPWELMRDPTGPVALNLAGVSRSLPVAELAQTAAIPGGRLRILMVISRPAGTDDIGYRMIARPLLERLHLVRGEVDLVVLRPPTLDALQRVLVEAVAAEKPFHVVHFDGHGVLPRRQAGAAATGRRAGMMTGPAEEGVLAFERPDGGSDEVSASKIAAVLNEARVPVVVLNACHSGAVGKDLEAAIATRLLREGCAAVVAMAYSVYAVAAAEFMAIFYERLFAGDTVRSAVTAGRRHLYEKDLRPSPKGELPLADWLVPVHYLRRDVAFPRARASRLSALPSLEALLDDLRAPVAERNSGTGSLDPVGVFVGRDDLFYQLEAAARLQKVVVLYGPGGTGKTELAKAFGRWWRDTGGTDKPEWVLWHSFETGVASYGLDAVIRDVGMAVCGPDFARLDTEDRRRVSEGLLMERRLLLIWDNFETVHSMPDPAGTAARVDDTERAKMAGFLARLAATGRSSVIITSRTAEDWLGPVRRVKVGGLAREEATQYAEELLAPYPAAKARRTRWAFGELLEWLDGHPLSMRLILPCLDATDPDVLLDGLGGTAPLPGGEGEDRATSLAASITYSFTHLSASTRRLLPLVSLFHGAADAVVLAMFSRLPGVPVRFAGASRLDWTLALDDAARVGLLTPLGAGIYRVHPALPGYLAERWCADDPDGYVGVRDAATRVLTTACAGLATLLTNQIESGDAQFAFAVLKLHRRTLGALFAYALDHQLWVEAPAIAQALNHYWDAHGLNEEADAWTDRVQIATEDSDGTPPGLDTPAGGLWLGITGAQADRQREAMRLDEAERTQRRILDMLQSQRTKQRQSHIATAYHQLGLVGEQRGRLEDAEDWYRKSLVIREGLGDRPAMATSYHQLGNVAYLRSHLENATDWYRKSLALFKSVGNWVAIATSCHMLGMVAERRGRLRDAEDWYRKSLVIRERLGDQPAMATSYHQLGVIAQTQGQLDDAEDWCIKSLGIFESIGHRPHVAASYHLLGMIAERRGRLEDAEDWYRKSMVIRESLGDRLSMAAGHHLLGNVAYLRGRLADAEDRYQKSLMIFKDLGDREHMAEIYHVLGVVAQSRGRLGYAEECYYRSLATFKELADYPRMALSYGQLGLLAEQAGQPRQALEWMVRSVAQFEEFSQPLADPGPYHLARLTAELGVNALEASWQEITGHPLPEAVRDYVTSLTRDQ